MFEVGDKVVYPHHGAGTVVKREKREVLGQTREYLTIKILHNDMTVNVPVENAEQVGLRTVIDEDLVNNVVKALTGGSTEMPKNWNRRFKHNRDKMKTGDIFELAEVVKNLSLRDHEKGLSTGEKQMFVKAKKILASELMYAKAVDEEEAAEWLEEVLAANGDKPQEEDEGEGRRDRVARARARDMSVWALLVAAGAGERLGEERPKAFVGLGELPLLAEPLRRLDESEWVDAIVVAAPHDWEEPAILLAEELSATKVVAAVTGGATRAESVRAALAEVPEDALVVLVHDAARPLVDDDVIGRVLAPLSEGWDGVVPALPIADTVKTRRRRRRHGHASPERARRRADAAGVRRATGSARAFAGDVPRRTDCASLVEARRRARHVGRRRPAPAQGDDEGRPGARRLVALKAVVFDVGETLVDETGLWERAADAAGVPRFTLMGVLGGLAARGEHHRRVWELLGVEQPASGLASRQTSIPTRCPASTSFARTGFMVGAVGNTPAEAEESAARARRLRRLVGALGRREARAGVLRADRRRGRARRRPRSRTSATGSTTTSRRRWRPEWSPCTCGAARGATCTSRRRRDPRPLARRAAGGAGRCLSCGSASGSTRMRSPTACRSSSAASRSTIRAGSPGIRTAT